MNLGQAVISGLRHSYNFAGRASRSEFWFFTLFCNLVVAAGVGIVVFLHFYGQTFGLVLFFILIVLLVPAIAISVRRVLGGDRTGWRPLITGSLCCLFLFSLILGRGELVAMFYLFTLVQVSMPGIAVSVRRLHDIDGPDGGF
jgi:uncharacterized membrane protein YhaH (DUF805 family)